MYNENTELNTASKSHAENQNTRRRIKPHRHIYDDNHTCVLCGSQHISNGKIFKGFCVCEECVEYVCSDTGKSA